MITASIIKNSSFLSAGSATRERMSIPPQEAIEILTQYGIVNGYLEGSFRPNQEITREEIIVMLLRLVNKDKMPNLMDCSLNDLDQMSSFFVLGSVTADRYSKFFYARSNYYTL